MVDQKHPEQGVSIVDVNGNPIRKAKGLAGSGGIGSTPYDAASFRSQHLNDWQPYLWSPDGEINTQRDLMVGRARDLVRNDGWASSAVTKTLDNVVGSTFRPISKPDYYALQQLTGNKGFDHKWAEEFGLAVDALWRVWANDERKYCDVERGLNVSQMLRLAFRHKLVDGDSLIQVRWMSQRQGYGAAYFSTALQVIDPDRLSNPQYQFDQSHLRGGVEIDDDGAPIAYHIRKAHQGDWFNAAKSVMWERIPKETNWGRPIIIHDYDRERGAQHRGTGFLTSVIERMKMLIKYDGTELDAAIVNAIFGAYITSPYDPGLVEEAMGAGPGENDLNTYQDFRADFHAQSKIKLNGVKMPILAPGEEINTVSAQRPNANYSPFAGAVLRHIAAGTGTSAQQITQDWSEVNYSTYRAAMVEVWKTFSRRRDDFVANTCGSVRLAWMEEAFDKGVLPLPAGAPDFSEFPSLYSRAKWIGPGRGYVDEVKEKQGSVLGMDAGLTTLEDEAATLGGRDYREVLDQRAIEIEAFEQRNLPLPKWTGDGEPGDPPAKRQIKPPEAD